MKHPKLYVVLQEYVGDMTHVDSVFVTEEDAKRQVNELELTQGNNQYKDVSFYYEEVDTPIELNEGML